MKFLGAVLAVLALPVTAFADPAKVERIQVIEAGIFTGQQSHCTRDSDGVQHCEVDDARLAVQTQTVPAQHGVEFGLRYTVLGAPVGAGVTIREVVRYPAPGVTPPHASAPLTQASGTLEARIGGSTLTTYTFDDPWELVPGLWTLELWSDNRMLLTRTFTVTGP